MFKKFLLLFILIAGYSAVPAQKKEITTKKGAFLELGGPGFGISLNYQRPFDTGKKEDILSWRTGLGLAGPLPGRDGGSLLLTLPAGLQYKPGKGRFEFGGGLTIFYLTGDGLEGPGFYISGAYYLSKSIRVLVSPFIGNRSTIKYHFGLNSPILPFGGIDIIF